MEDEEMDVSLIILKKLPLRMRRSDTVKSTKALINEKEHISEDNQVILHDGHVLRDDQRLIDCGIGTNSTLHVIVKSPPLMKMTVTVPSNNRSFTLEAMGSDTVQKLKSMIEEKEGFLSDTFALVYGGNQLHNSTTLASNNLSNESTVYLVFCQKDVLNISVEAVDRETVKLSVKALFTAGDVKAIVGSLIGVSTNGWELYFDGKQLESSKTLAFYDIGEGSWLKLVFLPMQIFVKTWAGKTLTLQVQETDTVYSIKAKVFRRLKIAIRVQSIVYAGKRLEDDVDLASYGIQNNSTLHMVLAF